MIAKVLFRKSLEEENEFGICSKYFDVVESRIDLQNSLVIARYSALPFYKELEYDLKLQNSNLINSFSQHNYIASFDYYNDIVDYTPKTWFSLQDIDEDGPFVVKGRTNSRKFQWNTHMYAETFSDVINVERNLLNDSMIGQQGIIYRKYIPLETFEIGLNGLRFTNEWRVFCYRNNILASGYYWSIIDKFPETKMEDSAIELLHSIMNIIGSKINFYTLDIAKTESGKWILVEANDGQMSGPSTVDLDQLYRMLQQNLNFIRS